MDKMEEKLIPIVEEKKNLKIKVGKLEKEIEYLKREERNNNIVIFGIEEKEKSTYELIQKIKENFKSDLNINVEDYEINKIHRLGNKSEENRKPRPILCSFSNNWKNVKL